MKALQPHQAKALANVIRVKADLEQAERNHTAAIAKRNQAIRTALATGLTLRQTATFAGISNPYAHRIRYHQAATPTTNPTNTGHDENDAWAAQTQRLASRV